MKCHNRIGLVLMLASVFATTALAQGGDAENENQLPKLTPLGGASPSSAPTHTPTSGAVPRTSLKPNPGSPPASAVPGKEGFYVHPLPQASQSEFDKSNQIMRDKRAAREAQIKTNSMDPPTKEAWERWSTNDYSNVPDPQAAKKRDFMNLQRDWQQVQVEVHKGNISPEANKKFMEAHSRDVQARYAEAAKKQGLQIKLQDPSGQPKPFSDVDIHGYPIDRTGDPKDWLPGAAGEMTPEQFARARQDFNESFNRDLANNQLTPIPETDAYGRPDNASRRTATDLMPITNDPRCFSGVECIVNPDGGVMYQDPKAVDQEVANRRKNDKGVSEGVGTDSSTKADYMNEQVRQQRAHVAEGQHLIDEGNRLIASGDPDSVRRGQRMLEQAQGEGSSLVGKYENRGNTTVNQAAEQAGGRHAGVDGMQVSERRQSAIDALDSTRDVSVTQQSADVVATSENAIRNQQTQGSRVMAESGNLSDAAELGRNAADAATKGEILQAARDGAYSRHQRRIGEAHPDWSPAEVQAAAGRAADQDARFVAEEMRTQTPDVPDPENNRYTTNENPNRGRADQLAAEASVTQNVEDLRTAREVRARQESMAAAGGDSAATSNAAGASDTQTRAAAVADQADSAAMTARTADNADNLARGAAGLDNAAPRTPLSAGELVDIAGRGLDAAGLGGQIGEAAVNQAGVAIDQNRDINASDVGQAALNAAGIPAMYDLGNRVSREVLIEVQRGTLRPDQAMDEIKIRLAAEVGNALVVAPVQQAIQEEWAAAEREGREPSYVSAAGTAAVEIGGNLTGITPIANAATDPFTWEARAGAAAQAQAMDQQLSDYATQTDTRITRLQSELEQLSLSGDPSDPATMIAIREREAELREANDWMSRIRATANRNSGNLSEESLGRINAQANAQANPDDIIDYIEQNLSDRGANAASGDELADAFAAAGELREGSGDEALTQEQSDFADHFAAADESTQISNAAQRTMSSRERDVPSTDLSAVWATEDALDQAEEQQRIASAAERQNSLAEAWNDTLDSVNQNATGQSQQGQQQLTAAQQQGQAALAAAAANPDPRMSGQDFNDQRQQLENEAEQLEQQRDQILTGGSAGGPSGPVDPSKGGQYGGAAIAAAARGDETGFDQRQANCDDVVKSGGNAPASITISGANFGGSASLIWDHYGVKDRIAVLSGGSVVFDSGCVPHEGNTPIAVGGQIKVIVEPNCDQTSSSQWEFRVACTAAVAQQ